MEKSNLTPFIRKNLKILFIGLNPAKGSSDNGHYFSVKQSFWEQLYKSGLILEEIDKSKADETVFGSTRINLNNWNYGITDLITEIAESDSRTINPTDEDCYNLKNLIKQLNPDVAVLLHGKVLEKFIKYLSKTPPKTNTGKIGKIIPEVNTVFFNIAFPHGNSITNESKIERYKELKHFILSIK